MRHSSDVDKINFTAQYLRGKANNAWEKHFYLVDPFTITWQSNKSFQADIVTTLNIHWVDILAHYSPIQKQFNQTVAAFVPYKCIYDA